MRGRRSVSTGGFSSGGRAPFFFGRAQLVAGSPDFGGTRVMRALALAIP